MSLSPSSPPPHYPQDIPDWARAAIERLVSIHPRIFAGIEARAGALPWITRDRGFPGLLRAICAQLVSNEAAFAIWRRLAALPGATTPEGFLALDPARIGIEGGLTRQKVAHGRALAEAVLAGRISEPMLEALPDEAAIAALTAIRGIGRWTAEVHLLFAQGRPDIFPAGDLALRAAVAERLGLAVRPAIPELAAMARAWAPHRAVAARLLWHHWLHHTGRRTTDPA